MIPINIKTMVPLNDEKILLIAGGNKKKHRTFYEMDVQKLTVESLFITSELIFRPTFMSAKIGPNKVIIQAEEYLSRLKSFQPVVICYEKDCSPVKSYFSNNNDATKVHEFGYEHLSKKKNKKHYC